MTEITQSNPPKLPTWYWAVCITAFFWNFMGLMAFYSQIMMSPETLAQMSQVQQELIATTPQWVNIAFGLAVVSGTLGSLGLLIRVAWCFYLLAVSFCGVIVQMIYVFFINGSADKFGPGGISMPIMVMVVAAGLLWFSKKAEAKKWLL